MNVTSLNFILLLVTALFAYGLAPSLVWRQRCLFAANAVFLGSFMSSPFSLIPMLAFAGVGFGFIHLASIKRNWPLWCSVGATLLLFIYFKQYKVLPHAWFIQTPYVVVGLSYVLFRIIHLMVDIRGGDIPAPPSFVDYFVYVFFFLGFLSGPIQRYQDFQQQQTDRAAPDDRAVRLALARIADGYLKTLVVAPLLLLFFTQLHQRASSEVGGKLVALLPTVFQKIVTSSHGQVIAGSAALYGGAIAVYAMYLFFNFAGYMDIVIGAGRLFGFCVPENFNHPFRAGNLMDFWARWHMTLTQWFKYYVFNPLFKAVSTRISTPALAGYLVVPVFFTSFFLMGVWHGSTLIFVVYGLFWGLGVSVNQLYQLLARRWMGKAKYASLTKNPLYQLYARAGTFCFFSISLLCFWMPKDEFRYIGHFLTGKGFLFLGVGIWVSAFIALPLLDLLYKYGGQLKERLVLSGRHPNVENLLTAAKLLLAVYYFIGSGSHAPEFVYRAF